MTERVIRTQIRIPSTIQTYLGLPCSSAGKESSCSAGDPGSIPGLGRSAGEGIGYPLQYSWVSLVAQLVKNLPAKWETWVRTLGWEDPLEKGKATHSSILGLPCSSAGKESACKVGDLGSIPGLGRSPAEGNSYPLQYSGQENSMDCIVHGVAKSRTRLSNFHFI